MGVFVAWRSTTRGSCTEEALSSKATSASAAIQERNIADVLILQRLVAAQKLCSKFFAHQLEFFISGPFIAWKAAVASRRDGVDGGIYQAAELFFAHRETLYRKFVGQLFAYQVENCIWTFFIIWNSATGQQIDRAPMSQDYAGSNGDDFTTTAVLFWQQQNFRSRRYLGKLLSVQVEICAHRAFESWRLQVCNGEVNGEAAGLEALFLAKREETARNVLVRFIANQADVSLRLAFTVWSIASTSTSPAAATTNTANLHVATVTQFLAHRDSSAQRVVITLLAHLVEFSLRGAFVSWRAAIDVADRGAADASVEALLLARREVAARKVLSNLISQQVELRTRAIFAGWSALAAELRARLGVRVDFDACSDPEL